MNDQLAWMKRHRSVLGLAAVALLVLVVAAPRFWRQMKDIHSSAVGGPFVLQEASGKTVTDRDFRGKWLVVYFGYTHCPDSCPTALNDIAAAMNEIGNHRSNVVPLFITTDPERDNAKSMQVYADGFDKSIVALSGTPAQIASVERAYRVYSVKEPSINGDYLMNHSSIIYIMDPDGDNAAVMTGDTDPKRLAAKLLQLGA